MPPPDRQSHRLKGYDYSQDGDYYVTICTGGRYCSLSNIVRGKIHLSSIGVLVDESWRDNTVSTRRPFRRLLNRRRRIVYGGTKKAVKGLMNQTPTKIRSFAV
jgi:hypothetical protein